MMMKNTIRVALLAVASAAIAAPVFAQDAPPPPPAQGGGMGHNSPEAQAKQLDRMTKFLALTPDQVSQIKAIQSDEDAKMSALSSGGAPEKGARKQMMAIRQDQSTRTRAVLTDDQKVKYDAMLEKMKEQREEKKGGGAGTPNPPPPPPPSN